MHIGSYVQLKVLVEDPFELDFPRNSDSSQHTFSKFVSRRTAFQLSRELRKT